MVFLVIAIAIFAVPLLAEATRVPVERRRKAGVPGELVTLSKGTTHILRDGPEDGPVAVLIHGLTTPTYLFAGVIPQLAKAGYRVIAYDLYGRGLSDRPLGKQDAKFFVDQLDDVLAHEQVDKPYLLLGYSMGGSIAAAKAAEDPDQIRQLVLVAPTGLSRANTPRLAEWPIVGDWVMWVLGGILLRARLHHPSFKTSSVTDLPAKERSETLTKGYLRGVLSSIRLTVQSDQSEAHRRIARAGLPVLAIWAENDRAVSLQSMARLADLNPEAWHHQIDGGDHGIIHNRPGEVGVEILRFLKVNQAAEG